MEVSENTPIEISLDKADNNYIVTIEATDKSKDDSKTIKYETTFTLDEISKEKEADIEDSNTSEEAIETEITDSENAVDDGIEDDIMESFKKTIRENTLLKKECARLKKEADTDGVAKLKEELARYKYAFKRTSIIASEKQKLEQEMLSLKEDLAVKNSTIKTLSGASKLIAEDKSLTESLNKTKLVLESTKTQLAQEKDNSEALNKKLQEQMEVNKKAVKIANTYKAKYLESLEKYIVSKAKMLAIKPVDIKNRLPEKYSIDDIEKTCDQILTESINIARLPFTQDKNIAAKSKTAVNFKESKSINNSSTYGYEIDDSLLELAGLK